MTNFISAAKVSNYFKVIVQKYQL